MGKAQQTFRNTLETNPETEESPEKNMVQSAVISTLSRKTHKVPEYNVFILDLAQEKAALSQKIELLKRKIQAENKAIRLLKHEHNRLHNAIDNDEDLLSKRRADTQRAAYNADIVADECGQLKREISQLDAENSAVRKSNEK